MPTFPSISPDYGLQKSSTPTVRRVQFGDGYMARLKYGLNQDRKKYNLQFKNLTEADSDSVETFLEAREGAESFDWTPPGESSAGKFICPSWSKTIPYANRATIRATFEEVIEP